MFDKSFEWTSTRSGKYEPLSRNYAAFVELLLLSGKYYCFQRNIDAFGQLSLLLSGNYCLWGIITAFRELLLLGTTVAFWELLLSGIITAFGEPVLLTENCCFQEGRKLPGKFSSQFVFHDAINALIKLLLEGRLVSVSEVHMRHCSKSIWEYSKLIGSGRF